MFSHVCVILFTGGVSGHPPGTWQGEPPLPRDLAGSTPPPPPGPGRENPPDQADTPPWTWQGEHPPPDLAGRTPPPPAGKKTTAYGQ